MKHLRHTLLLLLTMIVSGAILAQNDKQVLGDAVLTPMEIAEGATATYLIRFQNTGNDTATSLIIRDTLDPRLDFNTFEMVTSSHAYQIVRDESSNIIRWFFDDIYLPNSNSNAEQSIGFVMFTVRPKPFLAPGQVILNRACITFDQSQPICTNDAALWIDDDSNVDDPRLLYHQYQVVPNPNYGHFEVRAQLQTQQPFENDDTMCWITDLQGKTVWEGRADNTAAVSNLVSLEKPTPGVYLLWIKTASLLQVEQFAVIR
ncbi:MAG: hypothetical protein IT270_08550 [Saprospiraceae bacterium]|nr:hypothetical protein [Saprospiraceae bacterium]